jgi:membrane protease YdiL (CAAX protease family)
MDSDELWLLTARLLIILYTILIGWLTYRSHQLLADLKPTFNVLLSWPETISRTVMVGICFLLAWLTGLPRATLGLQVNVAWASVITGLVAGVVVLLLVNTASHLAIKRFGPAIYSPWLILNILPRRKLEWLLVALAFIPPIAMEELLFRSLWLGAFQNTVPLVLLIGGTSAVFGMMHLPQGSLGMVLAGVINIGFCLLFVWSGELLVTLVAHYMVNILQLVTASFQRNRLTDYNN